MSIQIEISLISLDQMSHLINELRLELFVKVMKIFIQLRFNEFLIDMFMIISKLHVVCIIVHINAHL